MFKVDTEIRASFKNVKSLALNLIKKADCGNSCAVVGYGDFVKELFLSMVSDYEVDIEMLNFDQWKYDGLYEFFIDENYVFSIDKLEKAHGYLETVADYIYLHDQCPYSYFEFLSSIGTTYVPFQFDIDEFIDDDEDFEDFVCDGRNCDDCEFCDESVAELDFDFYKADEGFEMPVIHIEQMYGNISLGDYINNY